MQLDKATVNTIDALQGGSGALCCSGRLVTVSCLSAVCCLEPNPVCCGVFGHSPWHTPLVGVLSGLALALLPLFALHVWWPEAAARVSLCSLLHAWHYICPQFLALALLGCGTTPVALALEARFVLQ